MRFLEVTLAAARARLPELEAFYGERLALPAEGGGVRVGETALRWRAGEGEPFSHFALLVPGDRFGPALAWARERVELLPSQGGGPVFDFAAWNARACYFHDPAGSIVELIAHAGVGERGATGAFAARELVGLSELGLVGDPPALAAALRPLGVEVWDGSLEPGRLAFAGERARTLILAPAGRGWLPTGRAAEAHPVDALLEGEREASAALGDLHVRVVPAR